MRAIDEAMNVLQSDYDELNKLYSKKEELKKELDKTLEKWLNFN